MTKKEKLQRKLARQNAKTEAQMTGYKCGQKSSTTRRDHSKGNYWNHYNTKIKSDMKPWWK